jgi:hypothetical protein
MINRIRSLYPTTEFTPSWNFPIYTDQWLEVEKIDKIRSWLLDREEEFIATFPYHHDGGAALGKDSVTSRHGLYSLFWFEKDIPEIMDLLKFIRESYVKFITEENAIPRDSYIVSWFNVARKDQDIKQHAHGADHESYLSGNIHLDTYDTYNTFISPYDDRSAFIRDNVKGGISIFPSCVPHYSSVYEGEEPRVSIAFDLRIKPTKQYGFGVESIPFMDTNIYNQLTAES